MKKYFSLAVLMLFVSLAYCQITERKLVSVSTGFLKKIGSGYSIKKDIIPLVDNDTLAYVVQLEPKGYLVLTSNEKLTPVLAFSLDHNFDLVKSKDNILLDMIINDMTHQLALINNKENSKTVSYFNKNKKRWQQLQASELITNRVDEIYGPLLSSVWGGVNCKDQDSSYIYVGNYYTPNHYSPGCVATSMAMILHYYRWPHSGIGKHTDYDNSGSSQGSYFADFGETFYDWGNMLDEYHYKQSDTVERAAMGLISYHYGIAVDMDYENTGSTSNINRSPDALNDYFRYTGHYETKSWSSFWSRMYENLQNGHPVQLAISTTDGHGHAPTVDGYWSSDTLSDKYYHMNMGWWGSWNNWYALQGSFNAAGYTIVDAAVFDILPDPEIEQMDVQHTDTFTLHWKMPDNVQCDTFELQKYTSGAWITIAKIVEKQYTDTVSQCGDYQYRVRARIDGHWYYNNYSETCHVFVSGDITSLYFDGNDSYFVNEHDNLLDVTGSDWTIETWVYPTEVPPSSTYPAIISRKYSFELYFRNTSGNLGVGILAFNGSGTGFGIEGSLNSGTNSMTLNNWHHIAASRSGSTTRLFIDGVIVGTSTDPDFDLDASISAVNFGARYNGGYERYINNCKLDEIRYSKTARYLSNFIPHKYDYSVPDNNDIFIFHLDEGSGRNIEDAKGNFTGVKLRYYPNDPEWSCDPEYNGFYVDFTNGDDSNPGTQAEPWKTINKVNNSTYEPGDHIKFKRGESWNEFLYFDQSKNGTEYAPIVIEPYGSGDDPVINYADYGVIFTGCSHIKLKDFEILSDIGIMIKDDSGTNPPSGIIIVNNNIHDDIDNGTTGAGIYLSDGANNCLIEDNNIFDHQIGIWTGTDSNGYAPGCENRYNDNKLHDNSNFGIAFDKTDCSEGSESVVSNNEVYNNGFHGIALDCRYYIAEHNLVYDNGQDSQGGSSGIHMYSRASDEDESNDRGGDHNIVRYNIISGTLDHTGARTDGNGIQMDMWCDSNLVYNNVTYDNDGAGIIVYGGSGNEIYNNTMYGNGQDLGNRFGQYEIAVLAAQLSGSNGSGYLHSANNKIKNNIGMATGSESTRFAAAICDTSILDNNIFENNLWYNNSGNRHVGIIDLINHTTGEKTMAEWNAYSWTNSEISADPLFVDAANNDFHLDHQSPAIDIGQDLTASDISDDIDLKPRPLLNAFDQGAYEHGIYWLGKYSSEWDIEDNWSGGAIPTSSSCVTIKQGYDYFPVILNTNTQVRKIVFQQGAMLKIMQGKDLKAISN